MTAGGITGAPAAQARARLPVLRQLLQPHPAAGPLRELEEGTGTQGRVRHRQVGEGKMGVETRRNPWMERERERERESTVRLLAPRAGDVQASGSARRGRGLLERGGP